MATKRSYEDACGAARALDLIGERWALLVVRELVLGPKRFTDLRTGLPGISPNVLTQRLTELETDGIVRRRRMPPPAAAWVYELTEWGQQLGPIIMDLGRWGARSPVLGHHTGLSSDAMAISLQTMFDSSAAAGVSSHFELHFGDDSYDVHVSDGSFDIVRGVAVRPDAVASLEPATLAGLVYFGSDLDDLIASGAVTFEGDRTSFKEFLSLFKLPEPIARAVAEDVPA